ncbi:MAG: hypothetical protein H9872_10700 [Candidatus Cellulosilyticum pullistercoris]|uniref:HlyD family secretion protein n=1 Tax=Candidatus Cellulosilyticum pullistercoris TaxID=2838521 RepID=A0A9E2NMD1_9FIRM|nr:hypothetical protein [Candidatus Cellulosilyticum pullistercoris]
MKQRKKATDKPKKTQRSYFNPYETTTPKRATSRNTYQQYVALTGSDERSKKASLKRSKTASAKKPSNKNATKQRTTQKAKPVLNENLSPEQRRAKMRQKVKVTKAQRLKMRRRRQFQMVLRVTLVMCLTIGMVWGGILLKEFLTKPTISTQIVKMGTLDTSNQFEGIIFRNEKVVYSEESGNVRYVIAEGEKVKKDGTVYVLVDEKNLVTTTSEKEKVDAEIYNNAENDAAISNNQDERHNLDQEVKSHLEDFYTNRYEDSTSYIYTLRSQLDSSVTNRTNLYATEQEEKNQELVALKEQLETDLGNYQKGKAAADSGIISYRMDGNETEDVKEAIETLTYKTYNKIKRTSSISTLGQSEINSGDPIYKVILNNEWYIVTYVDPKEAEEYTEGQMYTINFDELGGQAVNFSLDSKKEEENRVQLIFKTSNQINDFLGSRTVKFSIGEKATSGLKIPKQAIVEQNLIKIPTQFCVDVEGKTTVYRKKGEITEAVELNVQYTQDDMQYIRQDLTDVNNIQVNDILVNQADGSTYQISEVETKQGVYVTNNKVAKFKEIEIVAQSDEYAIVKNTGKSQLKEMDKIISNPKSIKIDQLIDDTKIENE